LRLRFAVPVAARGTGFWKDGVVVADFLPGIVYVTPDAEYGIFLAPQDSAVLVSIIEEVENEPTIAGPELDPTVLRELRRVLGTAKGSVREDESPIALPRELATYLELILVHAAVKAQLAPKLRFKCRDCLTEFTEDPGHLARRQAEAEARERTAVANDIFRIRSQVNAHSRFGTTLATYVAMTRPRQEEALMCSNCHSRRFDWWLFTFCPGCGAHRTETVLLRCPDCSYDYRELLKEPVFRPNAEVIDDFRIYWKQVAIINTVPLLWAWTGPGQIGDLMAEISPREKLLGVCKYSAVNGLKRHVIVLFTSEKVIWTVRRMGVWSDRNSRAWDQIQEISPNERSGELRITLANGQVVHFNGLEGTGADMVVGNRPFGSEEIRRASRRMLPARG
jgi:hypothetical protein